MNVIATGLLCLMMLPALARSAKLTGKKPHLSIVSSGGDIFYPPFRSQLNALAVHAWTTFKQKDEKNILAALNDKASQTISFDSYSVTKCKPSTAIHP